MVAFHPDFEDYLNHEAPADASQRALVWFSVNGQQPSVQHQQLQSVLSGIMDATNDHALRVYADSHPREWVELTVLNEFGPGFRYRPAYQVLVEGIYSRLFAKTA